MEKRLANQSNVLQHKPLHVCSETQG